MVIGANANFFKIITFLKKKQKQIVEQKLNS